MIEPGPLPAFVAMSVAVILIPGPSVLVATPRADDIDRDRIATLGG
ncbi:MAG: hypothetical protein ACRDXX_19540 [Stackebrandtia sp.]